MTRPAMSKTRPSTTAATSRGSWRRVAVPSEHGGWSLTAEPVLLGLLVAWSWPGLALGAAALVAFLARTPLKFVMVDRRRHRWYERSRLATQFVLWESVLVIGLAVAATAGSPTRLFWAPLAVAAPMVAVQLWFDMHSHSRRLAPELLGAVGISSVVAAIALVGGRPAALAVGLWVVLAARAVAAVPYARAQVFRGRGLPAARGLSDLAQGLSVLAVTGAWRFADVPAAPVVAIAVVSAFNLVAVRRPVRPVRVIGLQQMVFGLAIVAVTAIALLA